MPTSSMFQTSSTSIANTHGRTSAASGSNPSSTMGGLSNDEKGAMSRSLRLKHSTANLAKKLDPTRLLRTAKSSSAVDLPSQDPSTPALPPYSPYATKSSLMDASMSSIFERDVPTLGGLNKYPSNEILRRGGVSRIGFTSLSGLDLRITAGEKAAPSSTTSLCPAEFTSQSPATPVVPSPRQPRSMTPRINVLGRDSTFGLGPIGLGLDTTPEVKPPPVVIPPGLEEVSKFSDTTSEGTERATRSPIAARVARLRKRSMSKISLKRSSTAEQVLRIPPIPSSPSQLSLRIFSPRTKRTQQSTEQSSERLPALEETDVDPEVKYAKLAQDFAKRMNLRPSDPTKMKLREAESVPRMEISRLQMRDQGKHQVGNQTATSAGLDLEKIRRAQLTAKNLRLFSEQPGAPKARGRKRGAHRDKSRQEATCDENVTEDKVRMDKLKQQYLKAYSQPRGFVKEDSHEDTMESLMEQIAACNEETSEDKHHDSQLPPPQHPALTTETPKLIQESAFDSQVDFDPELIFSCFSGAPLSPMTVQWLREALSHKLYTRVKFLSYLLRPQPIEELYEAAYKFVELGKVVKNDLRRWIEGEHENKTSGILPTSALPSLGQANWVLGRVYDSEKDFHAVNWGGPTFQDDEAALVREFLQGRVQRLNLLLETLKPLLNLFKRNPMPMGEEYTEDDMHDWNDWVDNQTQKLVADIIEKVVLDHEAAVERYGTARSTWMSGDVLGTEAYLSENDLESHAM